MMEQENRSFRAGVDIGGTFTDIVVIGEQSHEVWRHKLLTTPDDPSIGGFEGLARCLSAIGGELDQVAEVIHGTTLAINCILERKGARAALVVSSGFRDVLALGSEYRYDIYDLNAAPAKPLIARRDIFEVDSRVSGRGETVRSASEESIAMLGRQLREGGYESVGVMLLHSYAWPEEEIRIGDLLARELPGVFISLSHRVSRDIREYPRTVLASMNAFVQPIAERYMVKLEERLRTAGFTGRLLVMGSHGGLLSPSVAGALPTRIIESGPAGGAVAASELAQIIDESRALSFDMGGTTAKACLVRDGRPAITTDYEVARSSTLIRGSGLPVNLPVVDMIEIGAGGGSIARLDTVGLLEVGPTSAGADPGPACYGKGGLEPTVTDANLVLGLLDASSFLNGAMTLDIEAARQAIARLAQKLDMSVEDAAWGIHRIASSKMADALRTHAIENGVAPNEPVLLAFGGAGPSHAHSVAEILGIKRVCFPARAGVFSAVGLLSAPVSANFVRYGPCVLRSTIDIKGIAELLEDGFSEVEQILFGARESSEKRHREYSADMRYVGQGYELTIGFSESLIRDGDLAPLIRSFEMAHMARFGRVLADREVEVVKWRGVIRSATVSEVPSWLEAYGGTIGQTTMHKVYLGRGRGFAEAQQFDRPGLAPGRQVFGPALIQDHDCAIFVGPGCVAHADPSGNIMMAVK